MLVLDMASGVGILQGGRWRQLNRSTIREQHLVERPVLV